MKAFLQSSMTVVLGLSLLYAFYQKKTDYSQITQATDIAMDSSFFVSQPVFEVKQPLTQSKSAIIAGLPAADKIDSLSIVTNLQTSESAFRKKAKAKPKIEIYELKKAPKTNLAQDQLVESKLKEVISQKKEEKTVEETALASVADANAASEVAAEQPLEKKKKFLFFSRKNKNN